MKAHVPGYVHTLSVRPTLRDCQSKSDCHGTIEDVSALLQEIKKNSGPQAPMVKHQDG
jgi:hypothetical protein